MNEPADARYAQMLVFPSATELRRRLPPLLVGFARGGTIGIGTVVLALGLGPLNHLALRRFHLPVGDDATEVLGE